MRMSVMFGTVAVLTGINLLSVPFHIWPAVWGVVLALGFVILNRVARRFRLRTSFMWLIVSAIIFIMMIKGTEPDEELRVLITIFALLASVCYAALHYIKEKHPRP